MISAVLHAYQQATWHSCLQAEIVIAKRHAEADASRHQKTVQDLATRSDELRQAQSSYNKSVYH